MSVNLAAGSAQNAFQPPRTRLSFAAHPAPVPDRWGVIARIVTDDLELAADKMRIWAPVEYTRLDRKPAGMNGYILALGPVLVGHWGGGSSKFFRTMVPNNGFGALFPTKAAARFGSTVLEPGSGVIGSAGADVAMYTEPGFRGILVASGLACWRNFMEGCGIGIALESARTRTLPAPTIDYVLVQTLLAHVVHAAEASPAEFEVAARRASLEDQLLQVMARLLGHWREPYRPLARSGAARHRAAVRAREYIDANLDQPLKLAAVCGAAYSSARALEYAFREMFGLTPMAYAKCARLSRVRRELRDDVPCNRSVTEVATRWGFWHLGQFSKDYQSLFGELPSATLAHART